MNESITELKRLHLLAKPEMQQALINIENIIRNEDGEAALFGIGHLSDAIKSYDSVEDRLFAEIESKNEKLAIAVKALEWYADEKNWNLGVSISMGSAFPLHEAIKADKGKRARLALKGVANE